MFHFRHSFAAGLASFLLATAIVAGQQPSKSAKDKDQRPSLKLSARPNLAMSPARVVLSADLTGGPNDSEDFYCPTVEWDWGDGTMSESSADCEPYEPGKSEIKRRYVVEHVFQAGNFRVTLRLKRHDKVIASAAVAVQIRPGLGDF